MIVRSISYMAVLNVLKAMASFLVSFLVARAVSPASFGLVSFSIPLMTFIALLTDLGLASAIVRHPELSRREAGAAVFLLSLAGLAGGVVLVVVARPAEAVLSLHGLAPVLAGYGLVTASSIWAAGPRSLLERQYSYTIISLIEALALAVSLAVFVAAIKMSAGIMALVAYQATFQLIRAVAFTLSARKLFIFNTQVSSITALMQIGGWVLITNFASYCARNLDNLLIGAYLGAASLGIYGLAYQFMTLPLVLLTWPVSGVLLSTLARLKSGAGGGKQDVICAVVTGTAAASFPAMMFLIFGARFPLDAIYTSRWHGLTDIIAWLAPVGAMQSIAAYTGAVLTEKGAVRLNFMLGLLNGCSLSAVFFATVWFGLATLVSAYMVAATLVCCVMIGCMCRQAQIPLPRFLACLVPGAAAACGGALAVAATVGFYPHTLGRWLLLVLVYGLTVAAVFGVLHKRLLLPARALLRSGGDIAAMGRA